MSKPTNKSARRYSREDAIRLHADAHKSDPFAAKRIAMTLRGQKDNDHVGKESAMIVNMRKHSGNVFGAFFNTKEGAFFRMDLQSNHRSEQQRRDARRNRFREKIAA
ncbi:hypothetical protein ACWX0O_01665 [Nitrobacteraceae bacterium UC4449_H16]